MTVHEDAYSAMAHCPALLVAAMSPEVAGAIIAVWLFALGGAVGSFLNVVIYRLPAGKSLVHPGSHCPTCEHPIRWYDNVPVLSWFLLGGRCRDCKTRISFRYPLVEAITATLFVVVAAADGLLGGAGLADAANGDAETATSLLVAIAQPAAIAAYHLLLLGTLLAAVLIELDGRRLPARLFAPALLLGWLAPLAWPAVHSAPGLWAIGPEFWWPIAGLVEATLGLALGALLGLGLWRWSGGSRGRGVAWGPACVGLFLGWQAALALTLFMLVGWGAAALVRLGDDRPRRVPPTAWLAIGTLGWIIAAQQPGGGWPLG